MVTSQKVTGAPGPYNITTAFLARRPIQVTLEQQGIVEITLSNIWQISSVWRVDGYLVNGFGSQLVQVRISNTGNESGRLNVAERPVPLPLLLSHCTRTIMGGPSRFDLAKALIDGTPFTINTYELGGASPAHETRVDLPLHLKRIQVDATGPDWWLIYAESDEDSRQKMYVLQYNDCHRRGLLYREN